jgi:hypothetical protein
VDHGVAMNLSAEDVRRYFTVQTFRDAGRRERVLVALFDRDLPAALWDGLDSVAATLLRVRLEPGASGADLLEKLIAPATRYVSIHDFSIDRPGRPLGDLRPAGGFDCTTWEFPRVAVTDLQIEDLLGRVVRDDPIRQESRSDRFFELLALRSPYEVDVRTHGSALLSVRGAEPWMDLCGRLRESEIRFAPGCELFHSGRSAKGEIVCNGVNVLPLRGASVPAELISRWVALGESFAEAPARLRILDDEVHPIGPQGDRIRSLMAESDVSARVVELGIGLMDQAAPLVTDWAAPTNESVPGAHVGIGADPGNPSTTPSGLHVDFVCAGADVIVNGREFLSGGEFPPGA